MMDIAKRSLKDCQLVDSETQEAILTGYGITSEDNDPETIYRKISTARVNTLFCDWIRYLETSEIGSTNNPEVKFYGFLDAETIKKIEEVVQEEIQSLELENSSDDKSKYVWFMARSTPNRYVYFGVKIRKHIEGYNLWPISSQTEVVGIQQITVLVHYDGSRYP